MTMLSQDDANEATDDIVDPTVSNQNHQQAPIRESERELRGRERVCVFFFFSFFNLKERRKKIIKKKKTYTKRYISL